MTISAGDHIPHGAVIHLFGTANNIRVPSAEAERLVLAPPGERIATFDLDTPNQGTFFVLSSQPMLADPILGFHALGTTF